MTDFKCMDSPPGRELFLKTASMTIIRPVVCDTKAMKRKWRDTIVCTSIHASSTIKQNTKLLKAKWVNDMPSSLTYVHCWSLEQGSCKMETCGTVGNSFCAWI